MKWNQRNRAGTKKQKNMAANQVDYSQDKGRPSFIRAGRKTHTQPKEEKKKSSGTTQIKSSSHKTVNWSSMSAAGRFITEPLDGVDNRWPFFNEIF